MRLRKRFLKMAKCDCCGEEIFDFGIAERNLVVTCEEQSSIPKIGVLNKGEVKLLAHMLYPKIVSVSAHASNKEAERFKRKLMKQRRDVKHFEITPNMLTETYQCEDGIFEANWKNEGRLH